MTDRSLANHRQNVTLWRCPKCGGTDQDSSQTARYCGRTRACSSKLRTRGGYALTPMERVEYVPAGDAFALTRHEASILLAGYFEGNETVIPEAERIMHRLEEWLDD